MEVEVYENIEDKKAGSDNQSLSEVEALIKALDIMDFNASLSGQNENLQEPVDSIDWIELRLHQ